MTTAGDPDVGTEHDRLIVGEGTTASEWRRWPGWADVPAISVDDVVPAGCRVVIVAPHPDDEVLATGGLLALATRAGREQLVIAVTDGEASHPGSKHWPVPELIAQRARERCAALAALGCRNAPVVRVGMPDGSVQQQALQQRVTELLRPSDVAVSPWRFDGHPDHEAVADAVGAATAAVGAVHVEAPIWGWHWASPDKEQLPWRRAVVLGLDARTAERKRLATRCYFSQLTDDPSTGAEPILPEWALDRLVHDREVFFR